MYKVSNAGRQRGATHILGAAHIHSAVVTDRAPHIHHGRQMDQLLHPAHGFGKRLWLPDIASTDVDATRLEPRRFLARQSKHANAVTPLLESSHHMSPYESVATGDQYIHRSALSATPPALHDLRETTRPRA